MSLLDSPTFYIYKIGMKHFRVIITVWLAISITACSTLSNLDNIIPPGWTQTPSPSPTPEVTFTPTVTPTPLVTARVNIGDQAFFNGDYDTALFQYQIVLQDSPDPILRAGAQWGTAKIYFEGKRYNETLSTLQTLIAEYPEFPQLGQAYYLQGLVNYRLENYSAAASSWQTYLTLRPGYLDAYVQELRGDALFTAQDYAGALAAYTAGIQASSLSDDIQLDLKVAATQTKLGNYETVLSLYDGIVGRATSDYIKAQALYEAGLVYQIQGQNGAALDKFKFNVENYPLSYYSYLSLIALLDLDGQVNELDRGLVDYFAGQYAVAIAAFDRYLESNPVDNDGTAYYYRAEARRDYGFYDEALADYKTFIANFPDHPRWSDAWGEKAFIEWYQKGEYTTAAETLLEFVSIVPNTTTSSEYLLSTARIYERDEQYSKALEAWARVANEYPGTSQAVSAIHLMGIINYRLQNYPAALEAFNRSLITSISVTDKARAALWIGKTQEKLGNNQAALEAWRTGQDLDPGGYYSERARDFLQDRQPFSPSLGLNLTPDLTAERADAETWLRLTFGIGTDIDLSGLGPLASDERIKRGKEFWDLGLYDEAKLEYENLRAELETNKDAIGSYGLTNYLIDLGLYRTAIFAARQTLTIAGLDEHTESMMAPSYFSHIRYGLYYSDILIPEAQAEGFDPLFIYSVVRQESLFEGFAGSSAGARGLMQVIPSTGAQIASELGKPLNYTDEDLNRPFVSILFGTHYLSKNRTLLGGDTYAMLAAYNGGPGNSLEWKKLSGDDPDLFLESIRFEETRNYIRGIYEIYTIYKRLYGTAQ